MRYRRVKISTELFLGWFSPGKHEQRAYEVLKDAIPEGSELVNVRHDWPNGVELLIRHDSFSAIKLGEEIPLLTPTMRLTREAK